MEKLGSPEPGHPVQGAGPVAGVSVAKMEGASGEEVVTGAKSKLLECACLKRWLPPIYREELYHILRLAGPLLLSRILNISVPFVITIFCGQMGNVELAGYALASVTLNVTTNATGHGLALACDTLISQTYGSKNMKRVGVILQRSSLIMLLFCLPCWALLINAENLLLLIRQNADVARIAQLYIMIFLPAVPAMFLHHLQVSYLQNQGITLPQMYTAGVTNVFNLGANYLLISVLGLGVVGSAVANSLSQIVSCLLLFGYIKWKKLHEKTWGGWTTDCLQDWGSYMKLATPSALMMCLEWWMWEIGGFLAGTLGEKDLAALHLLFEIGAFAYMFPLGISAAVCVRVGNALGAGNTNRALVACKLALVLGGAIAAVQGVVMGCCRSVTGKIFTSDIGILEIVSHNLSVFIFLQVFDSVLCVCTGILIGSGLQKIVAMTNLVSYYCIGLPVGAGLMFGANMRILGLWVGLSTCVFISMCFFLVLIFKLNWKKITRKAQLRAGKTAVLTAMCPASPVNEVMLQDIADIPDIAQLNSEPAPKTDGYGPVSTQDQGVTAGHETEENNTHAGGTEKDAEQNKSASSTKSEKRLPISELIKRRGLTLLSLALILVIGVAVHIAVPAPIPSVSTNFTLNWGNGSTPTPLTSLNLTSSY
ncbi:multidrug and toxin extrusion protein 1 [Oryzias melastigma]|uniref:Multidrug and toxin extrusion protein n=1 Tax=Oryzias melastigma TaxID=30732 RepID=A0A3B3CH30_ORYME|nr:multidrug and toxin extrusion protein 1 [Oryzias melastigma]